MLSTREIDSVVASSLPALKRNYCGTFAIDQLRQYEECVRKSEQFKSAEKRMPCCIVNTDPIDEPGEHWMALISLPGECAFFMFDSYGLLGFLKSIGSVSCGGRKQQQDFSNTVSEFFTFAAPSATDDGIDGYDEGNGRIDIAKGVLDTKAYLKSLDARGTNQKARRNCTFFYLCNAFVMTYPHAPRINVYFLYDRLQSYETNYCGNYCLYFLLELYTPRKGNYRTTQATVAEISRMLNDAFIEASPLRYDAKLLAENQRANTEIIREYTEECLDPILNRMRSTETEKNSENNNNKPHRFSNDGEKAT